MKNALKSVGYTLLFAVVFAVLGEGLLRLKNRDQKNYFIEMWRYAKELKVISPNRALGHVHKPNASARLQNVEIRLNSLGMRGPEPDLASKDKMRVLLVGSSITLGWGVPEEQTVRARLQEYLGTDYVIMNGAVGNANATRYVNMFESKYASIHPDIVVVQYFLNDAEILPPSESNPIMANSQLAVTLYYIYQGIVKGSSDLSSLVSHYKEIYDENFEGFIKANEALARLDALAREMGFKVVLTVIPDVHQLTDYPFGFVHRKMKTLADALGLYFLDFYPYFRGFEGPELWTIPGDPHPNARAHDRMAKALADFLEERVL